MRRYSRFLNPGDDLHACFRNCATGFIGTALVRAFSARAMKCLALPARIWERQRSPRSAPRLTAGSLDDLDSLRSGAAVADGVIHLAFIHDFSKFEENCEIDRRAIAALGSVLKGSDRPLVVTSGLALLAPGRAATEDDRPAPNSPRASEAAALALAADGVNALRRASSASPRHH